MADHTSRSIGSPSIDRPEIPAEYGTSKATRHVDWGHVEDRLTRDRVYWIATSGLAAGRAFDQSMGCTSTA